MKIEHFSFGRIRIDGKEYDHDVVIEREKIRQRKKNPSKAFRAQYGHTPLSAREEIPWHCRRLIIGTGAYGSLPIMDDVGREASKRNVTLVLLPTAQAVEALNQDHSDANAILHVTC